MRHWIHRSPHRSRHAFTLLEVLLATVIFGLVLAAITLTLRTGLRAWSTGHGLSEVLQTARITRDVLMQDLNNMVFLNESNYNIAYRAYMDQLVFQLNDNEDIVERDRDDRRERPQRRDRDRRSRRNDSDNEEAIDQWLDELSIETISPPIDLSFRSVDNKKTDQLSFARQYHARSASDPQTWGLRRVTYFVKDKVLYRQEEDPYGFRPGARAMEYYYEHEDLLNIASQFFIDGEASDPLQKSDTPIPGLPVTMQVDVAEPLCEGVEIFDLTFSYFKESEWVDVPEWDSGANKYRAIPFEDISEEHFDRLREEERQRYLQQKRMAQIFSRPDELPGTMALQIGVRAPDGKGRIYSFTLYYDLPLAQETDTLPDRRILEEGGGMPGMPSMPGMPGWTPGGGMNRNERSRSR